MMSDIAEAKTQIWTPERIDKLRSLWCSGHSSRQIVEQLGHAVSRNAVIGKAHRLGLAGRNQDFKTAEGFHTQKQERRGSPKSVLRRALAKPQKPNVFAGGTDLVELKPDAEPGRFLLVELESHQCRWPSGENPKGQHLFCGAKKAPGTCYCERHAQRAYTRDRREVPSEYWKFKPLQKRSALII